MKRKIYLLDTKIYKYDTLKIRLNSTSREKKNIEYKIKEKATISNNFIRGREEYDDKVSFIWYRLKYYSNPSI